jgi:predicted metal-dependent hydrolase
MQLAENLEFRRGIQLFNDEQFFECHEVLEEIWREAREPERTFLQALIHLAVSFYHYQNGNNVGAERQISKSLRKLSASLPQFAAVDTAALHREASAFSERLSRRERAPTFPRVTSCISTC